MADKLTGSCLCKRIQYTVNLDGPSEDLHSNYCHCTQCRRASGSVFASFFTVPKTAVTFNETPQKYESSKGTYRSFCPNCGSQMSWEIGKEDYIGIGIGTLDEPERVKPKFHGWVENKILVNLDLPKYLHYTDGELAPN